MENSESIAAKILLTDTDRRPYTARIAIAFAELGCKVFAVYTPGHPIRSTKVVQQNFAYSPIRPLESILNAIRDTMPDIVIPCDDRGVEHLHELYRRMRTQEGSEHQVCSLIDRSLGPADSFEIVSSRFHLLRIAQEEGLRVPKTQLLNMSNNFDWLQSEQPLPWVLKSDGTWGGRGVRIAQTVEQAREMFREIERPYRLKRALKRHWINRDSFWLRPWWQGTSPAIVAQSFVAGRPANCAVACWEGEVLGGIAVEVISAEAITGPACVVRVVEGSEMMHGAQRLAKRLKLSGFFGLDFMLEDGTGAAYLIEMNPRSTPLCHLRLGKGRDMIGALGARIANVPCMDIPPVTENDLIAYYPQAWVTKSEFLELSYQDIPNGEPGLLGELLSPGPERTLVHRVFDRFYQAGAAIGAMTRKSGSQSG